jgi:proline iminopeptidase
MIAKHEAAGTTSSPEYAAAMTAYYARYVTRQPHRSQIDADSSEAGFGALVYNYMWGPSEFTSTGTLKTFDATSWLRAVRVPTLFLAGEHDEATPASTREFSRLVPGAEFQVIPNAGHSTENDNPEALISTVVDFLRRVEAKP